MGPVVLIGGALILFALLVGDAKKASAATPAAPEPQPQPTPTPAPATPARKPAHKSKPKPTPEEQMTREEAQTALDQTWPLIDGGRADRDTLTYALRLAEKVGDTERRAAILKMLGG